MNKLIMMVGVSLCMGLSIGCASLEERLASSDPEVRREAEQDLVWRQNFVLDAGERMRAIGRVQDEDVLCGFALSISDPKDARYQDRRPEACAAIAKITRDELLSKIAAQGASDQVRKTALAKIKSETMRVQAQRLMEKKSMLEQEVLLRQMMVAQEQRDENMVRLLAARLDVSKPGIADRVLQGDFGYKVKTDVAKRLLKASDDVGVLYSLVKKNVDAEVSAKAVRKLGTLSEKISDEKIVQTVLDFNERDEKVVQDVRVRKALMARLSEATMVKSVLSDLSEYGYRSGSNQLVILRDATAAASLAQDRKNKVAILAEIFGRLRYDKEKVAEVMPGLPMLEADILLELLCADCSGVELCLERVSPDVARKALMAQKVKSADLERELLKRIPDDQIDMTLYVSAGSDGLKKAIFERMPAASQQKIREAQEKSFAEVLEKAKMAGKETFELDGFYLGMSFSDVKVVLAHHFPELEMSEDNEDGLALYVDHQSTPFCCADKQRCVYRFNFGKKLLKKWYSYDVQNYAGWANAYGRAHKIDMKWSTIRKDTTVFDSMGSYNAWFSQGTYQYKANAKGYRLTYFDDDEIETAYSGLAAAAIRSKAARDFRHVRGDPGSLRVEIEED